MREAALRPEMVIAFYSVSLQSSERVGLIYADMYFEPFGITQKGTHLLYYEGGDLVPFMKSFFIKVNDQR